MNVSDFIEDVNAIRAEPTYKNIANLILKVHRRGRDEENEFAFMLGYNSGYKQGLEEGHADGRAGNPIGTTHILGGD